MRATLEKGRLCCANLLLRLRVEYSCLVHQSNSKYIYLYTLYIQIPEYPVPAAAARAARHKNRQVPMSRKPRVVS